VYEVLYYVALATAGLTAIYTFRAFYLTFYGNLRVPYEAGGHAQEVSVVMWGPLVVLAIGAGIAGFAFDRTFTSAPAHMFAEFIGGSPSLALGAIAATRQPYTFHLTVAAISTLVALAGWLLATYLYLGGQREVAWLTSVLDFEAPARWLDVRSVSRWKQLPWVAAIHRQATRVGLGRVSAAIGQLILLVVLVLATPFLLGHYLSPYKLSYGKFYFDEIYQLVVVLPLRFLARACYTVDRWVVDGTVNLVGRIPPAAGALMRSLQMGLVPFYALAMLLGALVLFAAQWLWAAG
jgi:NADH-quinone oxidoreductase subunit L